MKDIEANHTISRRRFLITSSELLAAVIGLSYLDQVPHHEGIQNGKDRFYFHFAPHTSPYPIAELNDATLFWPEVNQSGGAISQTNGLDIINTVYTVYEEAGNDINFFPPKLVAALQEKKISILLPGLDLGIFLTKENQNALLTVYIALCFSTFVLANFEVKEKYGLLKDIYTWISRLPIIWVATGFTPIWVSQFIRYMQERYHINLSQDALISKLDGLMSSVHPEQIELFFYNTLVAYKALSTLSQMKGPQIVAGNFEMMHSGIQETVSRDKTTLLNTLLIYPDAVWKALLRANGGQIENITSTVVLDPITNKRRVFDAHPLHASLTQRLVEETSLTAPRS
ncbi:hypothetical protein C5B42_01195 [Candidatus Cerribacteria bacterium 'Amazon FNV 2010 28 9']|uniref:Uncharacterized protein n=1 Tax=Candidatus Cerribacteria bacterium 'Amazon FNV 2010 28 9' TaxID=2081795 RepID=A0A317JR46_9BACT|nr:MAG: hypothetical protein C5B42_01195 [Candidatus Cerribacteria bacterium 'Amazon FNV 2010 28 9']